MSLLDRLNFILDEKDLSEEVVMEERLDYAEEVKAPDEIETPESDEVKIAQTIEECAELAKDMQEDTDGIITVLVNEIPDDLQLPKRIGEFTVDDVQKAKNCFKAHLIKS